MNERLPAIYIMASKQNGTLYTGVTSNLLKRVYEHKCNATAGFTEKYGCKLLVYYEAYENMLDAIAREKQIKGGSRKKKLAMIEHMNPDWRDLYQDLL
jgi:putative endonuclease